MVHIFSTKQRLAALALLEHSQQQVNQQKQKINRWFSKDMR